MPENTGKFVSLKVKFSLFISFLLIVIMLISGQVIVSNLKPSLVSELKKKAEALASNLSDNCLESVLTGDEMLISGYLDKVKKEKAVVYAGVYDKKGKLVAHTDTELVKGSADATEEYIKKCEAEQKAAVYDVKTEMKVKEKQVGYVRVGFSEAEIVVAIAKINGIITTITIVVLVVSLILSFLLVTYSLRPLDKLSAGVKKIGEGDLDFKVDVKTNDELGRFAATFNEMTGNLKKAQENLVETEKMQHELKIAQQIQASLLPKKLPKVPNFDIATLYKSAKDVGGDYYDFFNISQHKLIAVVADVSGKGIPGALGMATVRSLLKANVKSSMSAREALVKSNAMFREDVSRGMFVTVGFLVLDVMHLAGTYLNAGHLPIIHVRANGEAEEIKPEGIAVGLTDHLIFDENLDMQEFGVGKGDVIVMFTDGINEAMNAKREEFGMERFRETLVNNREKTSKEILDALSVEIGKFTEGIAQSDDMTAIVIKAV